MGTEFCQPSQIEYYAYGILSKLAKEEFLFGLNRPAFIGRFAHYYGEINCIHPFREGNGRSQRAFLRQLAAAAGFHVAWEAINSSQNNWACQRNIVTGSTTELEAMLEPAVTRIFDSEQ